MVSIRSYLIIKALTLWTSIHSWYSRMINNAKGFYNYVKNYFTGNHDIWVWLPGQTIPISLDKVDNSVYIEWYYNNHTMLLDHYTDNENELLAKISWLSTKIRIEDPSDAGRIQEFNIDDFISRFRIKTTENRVPSLYTIFLSWCIYKKHWFSADSYIEFHIIDDNAEDVVINIDEHNLSLGIRQNKIYVVVHNSSEPERATEETNTIVEPFSEKNKKI